MEGVQLYYSYGPLKKDFRVSIQLVVGDQRFSCVGHKGGRFLHQLGASLCPVAQRPGLRAD